MKSHIISEMSIPPNDSFKHYFQIALSFSSAKLSLLSIKHPIHVIQIHKQAHPLLSNTEIIREIYHNSGIRGFYRSTGGTALRICLSESYRGLLMIQVPAEIHPRLPKQWSASHSTASTLITSAIATPVISVIDSVILCPILRMITLQMINKENHTLKNTYSLFIKGNLFTLYRGFTPLFVQTSLLWGNFLIIDDIMKCALQNHFNQVSYSGLAATSLIGGSIQTCISVIPDTIRVQMQKCTTNNLNMRATTIQLVKQHGLRSLFTTVPHKLFGGILGYGYKSILRHFWSPEGNR